MRDAWTSKCDKNLFRNVNKLVKTVKRISDGYITKLIEPNSMVSCLQSLTIIPKASKWLNALIKTRSKLVDFTTVTIYWCLSNKVVPFTCYLCIAIRKVKLMKYGALEIFLLDSFSYSIKRFVGFGFASWFWLNCLVELN